VVSIKGYDPDKMTACTVMFEGDKEECERSHATVKALSAKFNGMIAGPENGMRGYLLTFLIAYVRDFAIDHYIAAESFETSCPWSKVSSLCKRVTKRILDEASALGF